ncbi:MAG: hypothetical protein Q9199_005187 [Rusavskia elegans]
MRSRQVHTGFSLALCTYLPFTIATPKVADDLLLPLRIPQQRCHNFSSSDIILPPSVPKPATKCSWKDILDCGAHEINCGQICVGTVQRVPTTISPLSLQCRTCLSPSIISHCATCFGTTILTGFTPQTYSAPSITRDALCSAAKAIPEANCIVQGFCADGGDRQTPPAPSDQEANDTDPLAVVEQMIANLGPDAVGDVDVQQQQPASTTEGRESSSSSSSAAASTMSVEAGGRAAGLCGRFFCT